MTVADIAARRGITEASARRWVSRLVSAGALAPVGRDLETGAKLYAPEDVEAAIAAMPGQGARTDRPRPGDPPSCQDPPS